MNFLALTVQVGEYFKDFGGREVVKDSFSNKAVCRTALATHGNYSWLHCTVNCTGMCVECSRVKWSILAVSQYFPCISGTVSLPGLCWQVFNKKPTAPSAKSKLNKEILIQALTAVPGFELEGEDTKITESKLYDKPDQPKVQKKHGICKWTSDYVATRCTH